MSIIHILGIQSTDEGNFGGITPEYPKFYESQKLRMTKSPVTKSPMTKSPMTKSPTTESPMTKSPTKESPMTKSPVQAPILG